MATRSGTLAWRIPWTEEPSGPQAMGPRRVRHDCATHTDPLVRGHWGGPSSDLTSVLMRRGGGDTHTQGGQRERTSIIKPSREASGEISSAGKLRLRLTAFRTVRSIDSRPVCGAW